MDQQVENCWSFTLTHNLANVLAMHCGPRATPDVHPTLYPTHIPFMCHSTLLFMKYSYWNIWPWQSKIKVIAQGHIVSITSYQITSLSFHALPSLRYSYLKIWPWKSKVKVIAIGHSVCITYNILSTDIPFFHANWSSPSWYPFLSMPIGSLLHDIQHYQNWTLKIQGQGHSSKSYGRYNILSTHIPFVPCQSALLFLRYSVFKIWPWKAKVMGEVKVQSHNVGQTSFRLTSLSFHALPFLRYSYLKIWPWKSKVKVIAIGHSVCITYNILSTDIPFFHANWSSPSWYPFLSMPIGSLLHDIQHYQNWTLKIQGQGHSSKSYGRYNILSTHIPFVPCQSALLFLRYSVFKIWPWKTKAKVMGEVKVQSHNVGQTSFRLTSLLFHVNLPSHSWDKFSKFDLANPRSRS